MTTKASIEEIASVVARAERALARAELLEASGHAYEPFPVRVWAPESAESGAIQVLDTCLDRVMPERALAELHGAEAKQDGAGRHQDEPPPTSTRRTSPRRKLPAPIAEVPVQTPAPRGSSARPKVMRPAASLPVASISQWLQGTSQPSAPRDTPSAAASEAPEAAQSPKEEEEEVVEQEEEEEEDAAYHTPPHTTASQSSKRPRYSVADLGRIPSVYEPEEPLVRPTPPPPTDPYCLHRWPPMLRSRSHAYWMPPRKKRRLGEQIVLWVQSGLAEGAGASCLRVRDNWALYLAMFLHHALNMPVVALAFLSPSLAAGSGPLGPLESARIAALDSLSQSLLAECGVPLITLMAEPKHVGSVIVQWVKARKVHLVLTSESYAPSVVKWIKTVSRSLPCPVYSIDADCVMPVRYVEAKLLSVQPQPASASASESSSTLPAHVPHIMHEQALRDALSSVATDLDWPTATASMSIRANENVQHSLWLHGLATQRVPYVPDVVVDRWSQAPWTPLRARCAAPPRCPADGPFPLPQLERIDTPQTRTMHEDLCRPTEAGALARIERIAQLLDSESGEEKSAAAEVEFRNLRAYLVADVRAGLVSPLYAACKLARVQAIPELLVIDRERALYSGYSYAADFIAERQGVAPGDKLVDWSGMIAGSGTSATRPSTRDDRPTCYLPGDLFAARTNDALWNAIQKSMLSTQVAAPELFPFWAARLVEWSESREEALSTALSLLLRSVRGGGSLECVRFVVEAQAGSSAQDLRTVLEKDPMVTRLCEYFV